MLFGRPAHRKNRRLKVTQTRNINKARKAEAGGPRLSPRLSSPVPADMFSVFHPAGGVLLASLGLLVPRLSFASLSVPDIPHIAGYFGTKTRYEEVNPHLLRDPLSADPSVLRPPPAEQCSPVHLTAVIRHGSRYPTLKNIRRIRKLSELVRTEASRASGGSESWLQAIRNRWEAWYTEDMDGEPATVSTEHVYMNILT